MKNKDIGWFVAIIGAGATGYIVGKRVQENKYHSEIKKMKKKTLKLERKFKEVSESSGNLNNNSGPIPRAR